MSEPNAKPNGPTKRTPGIKNEIADNPKLRHNFISLTVYHVLLRLGWIFKTESIIIPSVLDSIGGTPTLRGLLPMLSRFGISIPPVIAASSIRNMRRKKIALCSLTMLMGACFLLLASCWLLPKGFFGDSFPYVFLAIYSVFFIFSGINQLSFGTLQGKVIPPTLRGRLMLACNVIGATLAVGAVLLLLPRWLTPNGGSFQYVFGFTGVLFLLAGLMALLTNEDPDEPDADSDGGATNGRWNSFAHVLAALKEDANLRNIALMASLSSCYIMLFPHFQALARDGLQANLKSIVVWVAVQNVGTATFSLLAGWTADRFGNRIVLRFTSAGLMLVPPFALILSKSGLPPAAFSSVFFVIGLTPVMGRIIQHYTLELTEPANHPRYLAAVSLCSAIPFLLSGVVGYLIERLGYDPVFLAITFIIALSFLMTFRLVEPRDLHTPPPTKKSL